MILSLTIVLVVLLVVLFCNGPSDPNPPASL
jgi:hypothetical protein